MKSSKNAQGKIMPESAGKGRQGVRGNGNQRPVRDGNERSRGHKAGVGLESQQLSSSKQRSRMTNGTALLPDVDGRSAIARRFKDITSGILADQGGADLCSETRKQLIRRFAAAAVIAEQLEAALARGEAINVQEHALLCSTLTRLATRIGINRTPRDITPSLRDYLDEEATA